MDVKEAWNSFYRTGRVQDYIHYTQLKQRLEARQGLGGEAVHAAENPGAGHQGTGGGRERPPGDGSYQG